MRIEQNYKSYDNEHRTAAIEEKSRGSSNNINNMHQTTDREGRNRCSSTSD